MGLFNLGGIVDAFSGRKTKRMYYNKPLQGEIDESVSRIGDYRSSMDDAWARYNSAMDDNISEQRRLNALNESEINDILASERNYNFLGDRERVRDGDLASLEGILSKIGGGMSRADKVAAARLGYAGRPSGSYMDKARSSYLGAFAAPTINSIFAGLTPAASAASRAAGDSVNRRLGLMDARSSLPDRITDRILAPAQVRSELFDDEIAKLAGLTDVSRSNIAGFKEEINPWAKATMAMDDSLNSAADMFASLYGLGGMGGGGGVGGMSSLGGIGGIGGILGMFGGGGMPAQMPSWASPWSTGYVDPYAYSQYMAMQRAFNPLYSPSLYE